MDLEREAANDGGIPPHSPAPAAAGDGIITYKRRRMSRSSCRGGKKVNDSTPLSRGTSTSCPSVFQQSSKKCLGNWRTLLQSLLRSPQITCGDGIYNSILNALANGPSKSAKLMKGYPCATFKPKQDIQNHVYDSKMQSSASDGHAACVSTASRVDSRTNLNTSTSECQNAIFDIILSERFALLCETLSQSSEEIALLPTVDFNAISLKEKNGEYGRYPSLLHFDMQQICQKIEELGKEMTLLGSNLSTLLRSFSQKQVCAASEFKADVQKTEENDLVVFVDKVTKESTTTTQLTSCDSGHLTRQDQTDGYVLHNIATCKLCNGEVDARGSLICDGCEGTFHFSCIEPSIKEVPTQSWFCSACSRLSSLAVTLRPADDDGLHDNCVVCDKLEVSEQVELCEVGSRTEVAADTHESCSPSSMEADEGLELSTTAMSHLCKQCGACEDDDKKFLICGHKFCLYRYYHIRCLKSSQIASVQQQQRSCWYCPSCLCRGCFVDKDDDKIVLCDGCDEAYHIYCMKPPRTTVPRGQWYCFPCNVERAKEGMRKYEQIILQQHRNSKHES